MRYTTEELRNKLQKNYGIKAVPIGEPESFDLRNVRVYEDYPDKFSTKDFGYFEMQEFQVSDIEQYKLIVCDQEFPEINALVSAMENEELRDVKDYVLIQPNVPSDDLYLYKLVPFTVQGQSTWS